MRNSESLMVSLTGRDGEEVVAGANACSWDDFLFHLGPVVPRLQLHQADRELRARGAATLAVNDRVVDEVWIKSFLLTEN
jgi:hypothetical protein